MAQRVRDRVGPTASADLARQSYGMRSSGIVIVRPDGHVGLFGDARDVDGYLQLVGLA